MPEQDESNPLQGYFEWQVTTVLLAYDLVEPIPRGDQEAAERRRRRVEEEVSRLALSVIPEQFQKDPSLEWPPEVMMRITKATFLRSFEIAGESLEAEFPD